MRARVKKVNDYGSAELNRLARDIQATLNSMLDSTVHKATLVWNPPFLLRVPLPGGFDRLTQPDYIRCERAVNLTDSTILTTPGGCSWVWDRDGQARIDAVSGLTVGQKYELVFSAVG